MDLSPLQKTVLVAVCRVHLQGAWYRAASSGERVTLSSLHRQGLLVRHAWRGREGHPDCAYEYQPAPLVQEVLQEMGLPRPTP